MKRFCITLVLVGTLLTSSFAQTTLASLTWKDARSMGSGGTSLLFSTGYDSFFGNPAGFAQGGSLTLGDASLWSYLPVTPKNLNQVQSVLSGGASQPEAETVFDDFLADNSEAGIGGSAGLGWAGKGFGVGANIVSEAKLTGSAFASSKLVVRNQVNAILGFAIPVNLGFIHLAVGADARGFYRLDATADGWADAYNLVLAALGYGGDLRTLVDAESMTGGLGYALDAGATLKIGPLMAGIMARNLFGQVQLGDATVKDMNENSNYPVNGTSLAVLNPIYTGGVGLSLNEDGLLSPSLYAETDDILGFVDAVKSGLTDTETVLSSIRIGGEIRLLRIFIVRGGLNANCLSMGAGIDLHIIRADVALFGEDISSLHPRTGLAVRAAVKF
ncbi:MAG: hypothetical protein NT061_06205 [Spirochaetes bacterium]|nr:hypothetical protein [Spirochaetota bacterium]